MLYHLTHHHITQHFSISISFHEQSIHYWSNHAAKLTPISYPFHLHCHTQGQTRHFTPPISGPTYTDKSCHFKKQEEKKMQNQQINNKKFVTRSIGKGVSVARGLRAVNPKTEGNSFIPSKNPFTCTRLSVSWLRRLHLDSHCGPRLHTRGFCVLLHLVRRRLTLRHLLLWCLL